jgi:eukaryotic-like serine/threonine-protein kinase
VFEPGTVVDGKYRIDRELGHGGMGVVVAATHLTLGTRVALKCMNERVNSDEVSIERFWREARAAAQLRSDHICRVLDVGNHDGMPYIVMELLEGTDLGRIAAKGKLDVATAVDYLRQACAGLAVAHANHIVHRDLKPENLFLARGDGGAQVVKLLDFGVAKAPDAKGLTGSMQMIGSPAYMSPEQILSSRDVDERSDIWALGVILYRLVAGRMPFTGINVAELTLHICEAAMPGIGGAPPELLAILARCLDKQPANRFASAEELALALRPFGTDVGDTNVYRRAPSTGEDADTDVQPDTTVPGKRDSEHVTTQEQLGETVLVETAPAVTTPRPAVDSSPGVTTPRPAVDSAPTSARPVTTPARPRRRPLLVLTGIGVAAIGGVVAWRLVRGDASPRPPAAAPPVIAPAITAPVDPAPAVAAPAQPASAPAPAPEPPAAIDKPKRAAKPRPPAKPAKPRPTDEEISRSRI